jgi:hypothetical protein
MIHRPQMRARLTRTRFFISAQAEERFVGLRRNKVDLAPIEKAPRKRSHFALISYSLMFLILDYIGLCYLRRMP